MLTSGFVSIPRCRHPTFATRAHQSGISNWGPQCCEHPTFATSPHPIPLRPLSLTAPADAIQAKPRPLVRVFSTIEAQTVESTIRAYGAGEIELPEVPKDTNKGHIRYADKSICKRPYSTVTLAKFLGWQTFDEGHPEGRPNHACNVAFQMLDKLPKSVFVPSDERVRCWQRWLTLER